MSFHKALKFLGYLNEQVCCDMEKVPLPEGAPNFHYIGLPMGPDKGTGYPEITLRHMHNIAEPLTLKKYKDLVYSSKIPEDDLGRGTILHSRGDSFGHLCPDKYKRGLVFGGSS